ncbi:hypothetical protein AB0O87_11640 [Microbacterium sp. NPDC076768]|uniref:hypothetical protein n=1 Tax=Microbacterium sp. NPDC076768 TaxID=3154858 RepID=UPI003444D31A
MTEPNLRDEDGSVLMEHNGGHQLPGFFSANAAHTTATRPRRRKGVILGVLGGAGIIAALVATQVGANLGYDQAATRYDETSLVAFELKAEVRADTAELRESASAANLILSRESRSIVVEEDLSAALSSSLSEGEEAAGNADVVVSSDLAPVMNKPVWFWELFGRTTELNQNTEDAERLITALQDESGDVVEAEQSITTTGIAVLQAASTAAAPFETAHLSARNDAVIELRTAAASVANATLVDQEAAAAYISLQDAGDQVIATEAAELAEKEGPLKNARLEIEAYARSIAPEVLLEFDWSPVVNGAGYNGSMGGYTTWWWETPGRANIELSNSVAEQWPAARSKALVAHEIGHAISVKCQDMYDSSTQDSIEKWATAWAIGMGHTDDANGVWAYGYPPQSYIDAASGCR